MLVKRRFIAKISTVTRFLHQALYANQQFTIDEMHNYRMAVTEREVAPIGSRFVFQKDLTIISHLQVINGCISQTNSDVRDHVIIYTRILQVRIVLLLTFPV